MVSAVSLCRFFLSVCLPGAVAAAEPKVQALRKLPEDIEWSYTGVYEVLLKKGKYGLVIGPSI